MKIRLGFLIYIEVYRQGAVISLTDQISLMDTVCWFDSSYFNKNNGSLAKRQSRGTVNPLPSGFVGSSPTRPTKMVSSSKG